MEAIWRQIQEEFDSGHFAPDDLPYQRVDGKVLTRSGKHRSTVLYKNIVNQGVNCIIQRGLRQTPTTRDVAIKRPKYPHTHLHQEAALQFLAHGILERDGIHGAIPKVYDIFRFADEVRFTMEWIEGQSAHDFLQGRLGNSREFEHAFLHVLAQTAILLDILGRRLHLDHRDMKLDNIWIRRIPGGISYPIPNDISSHRYTCPFQVVLLDFGFACIGSPSGRMAINLGNVIPDIDSCPKEGRDLYHILNRLLEPPRFAESLSAPIRETLIEWLGVAGLSQPRRTHVLTSLPSFSMPTLNPRRVLEWALLQIAAL
jgi:serine/threonine protein kinase